MLGSMMRASHNEIRYLRSDIHELSTNIRKVISQSPEAAKEDRQDMLKEIGRNLRTGARATDWSGAADQQLMMHIQSLSESMAKLASGQQEQALSIRNLTDEIKWQETKYKQELKLPHWQAMSQLRVAEEHVRELKAQVQALKTATRSQRRSEADLELLAVALPSRLEPASVESAKDAVDWLYHRLRAFVTDSLHVSSYRSLSKHRKSVSSFSH